MGWPDALCATFAWRLGGVMRVSLRQSFTSLDFYTALLLGLGGLAYRVWDKPERAALPVLGMLVAVAWSTYAQRLFGRESAGSMARYRLLPVAGWQLLLAKDAVYLALLAVLVSPLGFANPPAVSLAPLAFGLMALAMGRWPSLQQGVLHRPWRFTGGDVRFGLLQLGAGGLVALLVARVSAWCGCIAVAIWLASLVAGQRWWVRASSL